MPRNLGAKSWVSSCRLSNTYCIYPVSIARSCNPGNRLPTEFIAITVGIAQSSGSMPVQVLPFLRIGYMYRTLRSGNSLRPRSASMCRPEISIVTLYRGKPIRTAQPLGFRTCLLQAPTLEKPCNTKFWSVETWHVSSLPGTVPPRVRSQTNSTAWLRGSGSHLFLAARTCSGLIQLDAFFMNALIEENSAGSLGQFQTSTPELRTRSRLLVIRH